MLYFQKDLDTVFGTTRPSKHFLLLEKTKMAELVLTHLNTSYIDKQQQEAFYTHLLCTLKIVQRLTETQSVTSFDLVRRTFCPPSWLLSPAHRG